MRILFVCHRFPFPPKRGGKIRPFNILSHFHSSGHEVHLASLVRSDDEAAETVGIEKHVASSFMAQVDRLPQAAKMVLRLPTTEPSSMGWFHSRALARHVDGLLATHRFDLIFVHCSSVAQYVRNVRNIPKILDFGDMDSQKWLEYAKYKSWPLSMGYAIEGAKLQREETRLVADFDLCTTTTYGELETLQSYGAPGDFDWFPNGVDTEFFSQQGEYAPHKLCFVGRMDYFPNQDCVIRFTDHVFPRIRQVMPEAEFVIIGADPPEHIRRLGEIPGVTVTGSVKDVRPYARGCAAMVATLNIARGTQNKILEAMAMGIPVVSSTAAAKGVDARPGDDLIVEDTPERVAAALLRLMRSSDERARLSASGRARVLTAHAWPQSMRKLDSLIDTRRATGWRHAPAGLLPESVTS
jgi:sugar transferase (PEP-CTERM/EpsH1 system associated)